MPASKKRKAPGAADVSLGANAPILTKTSGSGVNPLSWTAAYHGLIVGSDYIAMRWRLNGGAWTNETSVLFDSDFFLTYGADAVNFQWPLYEAASVTAGTVVDVQEGVLRGGTTVWSNTLTDTMSTSRGGGSSTATWDTSWDDNTFLDITGSNRIATHMGGTTPVRSNVAGTGKKVASVTVNVINAEVKVGLCNGSLAQYSTSGTNTLQYANNTTVSVNGADLGAGWPSFAAGDRLDIAFDRTANRAWLGKNGTWVGNPVAGTGGIDISGLTGNLYFYALGFGSGGTNSSESFDPNHTALGALSGFSEL